MTNDQSGGFPSKSALRAQLVAARRQHTRTALRAAAQAVAAHLLDTDEVRRAATITAYVSIGSEPGTGPLIDALHAAGKRVLVPLTTRDLDLDWAPYEGRDSLAPARFGLLEPTTEPRGLDSVASADVLLVPGMGVSTSGVRIGKGGGCYDRALSRVPADRWRCVLLFPDEVGRDVPAEEHDQRVHAACTPAGLTRLRPPEAPAPG